MKSSNVLTIVSNASLDLEKSRNDEYNQPFKNIIPILKVVDNFF